MEDSTTEKSRVLASVHLLPCHIQNSNLKVEGGWGSIEKIENLFPIETVKSFKKEDHGFTNLQNAMNGLEDGLGVTETKKLLRSQFRGRELFGVPVDLSKHGAHGMTFESENGKIKVRESVEYM